MIALLDIGADIEGADSKKDMTPLIHVVSSRFFSPTRETEVRKIYMTLIDRGANVHATTRFGSVVDLAQPEFLQALTNLIRVQASGN